MASVKKRFVAFLLIALMLLQGIPAGLADTLYSNEVRGAQTFTVIFTDKDDNTLVTQLVESGSTPVQPDIPDVDGYEFIGWQVNGGDIKPIGEIAISADTTLKASYAEIVTYTCTVRYLYASDDTPASEDVVYEYRKGASVDLTVPTPELANFTADQSSVSFKIDAIDRNYGAVVRYTGNQIGYTVNHVWQNVDDNNYTTHESENKSGEYGRTTAAEARSYDGFTVVEPIEQKTLPGDGSDEVVVEVKYNRNTHSVIFNNNGGVNNGAKLDGVYRYGKVITLPNAENMTRLGYTFAGWKINGEGDTLTNTVTVPDNDITLVAQWTANTTASYTVVYWQEKVPTEVGMWTTDNTDYHNGYDFFENVVKTGRVGDDATYDARSYEGFKSTPVRVVTSKIEADGSTVVNVYYAREVYNLYFYNCGATSSTSTPPLFSDLTISAKYGTDVSSKWQDAAHTKYQWAAGYTSNRREGYGNRYYDFDAKSPWYTLFANMPANDVNMYSDDPSSGKYIYYYVEALDSDPDAKTVNGISGKVIEYARFEAGSGVYLTDEDKQPIEGFEYKSWQERGNPLWLYYTRSSFKISFANCKGVNDASVKFEDVISTGKPNGDPQRPDGVDSDYNFGGWYTSPACEDGTEVDWTTKMPAHNMQVYAKWVAPTYTVTFHYNDAKNDRGVYGEPVSVTKYQTVEDKMPADPDGVTADYKFAGWYQDPECTLGFMPGSAITGNTDVYAKWTYTGKADYDVIYVDEDGNQLKDPDKGSETAGEELTLNAPAIPGYIARKSSITFTVSDGYTVTFVYKKIDSWQLTVKYLEAGTNKELSSDETFTITAKEKVVSFKEIPNYNVDAVAKIATAEDNTIIFYYTPITDKDYKVEYYLEQSDGTYKLEETVTKPGKLGDTARITDADKKSFPNYTLDESNANSVTSATILADGSTTLKLYYKLNTAKYTIHHYLAGTTVKVADDVTGTKTIGDLLEGAAVANDLLYSEFKNVGLRLKETTHGITIRADETQNVIRVYYWVDLTITAKDAEKVYDGQPLTQPDFDIAGLINGDTKDDFILSMTEESTITNVGSTKNEIDELKIKYTGKTNTGGSIPSYYNVTLESGTLEVTKSGTLTVAGEDYNKPYDGATHGEAAGASVTEGTTISYSTDEGKTWSTDVPTIKDVGEIHVLVKAENPNYTTATNDYTLKVTPKAVTVTADDKSKVYGDADPKLTATVDGLLGEDTVDYTLSRAAGENVGHYTITPAGEKTQGNYEVTYVPGDFEITKANITKYVTLTPANVTEKYDGKAHATGTARATDEKGNALTIEYSGDNETWTTDPSTITSTNVADSRVVYVRVSSPANYDGYVEDTQLITITKRSVTLTSATDSKVYDGTPLTRPDVTVTGDGFVDGEVTDIKATGSVTYVTDGPNGNGKVPNTITYTKNESFNIDNYEITEGEGTLSIEPVTDEVIVTIIGNTNEEIYDGTEKDARGYGHRIEGSKLYTALDFTFKGDTRTVKGTDAGTYNLGLKPEQFENKNPNFTNVTFKVERDTSLTINKRPVKVTAIKLEYDYDYANPVAHPADNVVRCDIESANDDRGLLEGDTLNVDVLYDGQNTQTLIGVYAAVAQIANATITNSNGDVTDNYTIEKVDSTLTIKGDDPLDPKKETTNKPETNFKVGDTIEYTITVKNVSKDEAENVVVTDNMAEIQPGDGYTVSANKHTATIASIPAGGTVLVNAQHTVTVEDVEGAYATDAADGTLTNVANIKFGDWNKDVVGDHDELNDTYNYVVYYYWNNTNDTEVVKTAERGTARVGAEVAENPAAITGYTPVSAASKKLIIRADNSLNVIKFYYYKDVELTAKGATYNYDGTEKSVSGYDISGEKADYAADFSGATEIKAGATGTDVGTYPATFEGDYVGTVDNTGRYIVKKTTPGELVINPASGEVVVTIVGHTDTAKYDGKSHTVTGYDVVSINDSKYTVANFTFSGKAEATGTDADTYYMGLNASQFTNISDNFSKVTFVVTDGKLTITKRSVTLTSETASKPYDGTPLTRPDVTVTGDDFVEGEVSDIKATGSVTFVTEGAVDNTITYTKGENFKDKNYDITENVGKLTVTQNEKVITITANSHTWEYDGQPHSDGGYTVEYDGKEYTAAAGGTVTLPTGDVVEATVEGTVTNVADSADDNNVVTGVTITNASDDDMKGQYKTITIVPGGLKITKRGAGDNKVTITANDNTVEYDGKAHGENGHTDTYLAEGHSVESVIIDGSQIDAGTYEDELVPRAAKIVDADGNDVTENYVITYVAGDLTITKRGAGENKVTIKANDNLGVVYDGKAHGENGHTDTYLAEGHSVKTVTIDGSRTAVGKYPKELVPHDATIVDADGNDVTENYVITYMEGDLEIVSPDTVVVRIKGNSATVEYDGKLHEVNGYTVVNISNALYTASDFDFAEGAAAHAEGVDADTYPMNLTSESFVNKNANFAKVSFIVEDGALTITKRGAGDDKVTITANDNTVEYDGEPHGENGYTFDNLAEGHSVKTVTIDGSQIDAGIYKDELVPHDAIIVDANGNDVTKNYEITYVAGDLTITKRGAGEKKVTITARDHTVGYDGKPHGQNGYTSTRIEDIGHRIASVDIPFQATLVGKYENELVPSNARILDADGNDVTENYEITYLPGTLEITGDKIEPKKETTKVESNYKLGDKIPFTITVKNQFDGEVKDVKVVDMNATIVAGEGYTVVDEHTALIAVLAKDAVVLVKAEHTVTSDDILNATVENRAIVSWDNREQPVKADTDKIDDIDTTLEVVKTSDYEGKKAELGQKITYTITVTNKGNVPYKNVKVDDNLTGMHKTIDELPVGASESFTTEWTVTEDDILRGHVLNVATAEGDEIPDPKNPDNPKIPKDEDEHDDESGDLNTTLEVVKTSNKQDGEKAKLGEKITYTITVTNKGNVTYKNVKVDDDLTNLHETIAELPVGKSESFTTEWIVTEDDILRGHVLNVVTAKGDDIPDPKDPENPKPPKGGDEEDDETDDLNTTLEVVKTSNKQDGEKAKLGEKITYTITVTNKGNVTYKNVKVDDDLTNLHETIAELPVGASESFTTEWIVTEEDILRGHVLNVVTAKGDDIPDPKDPENPKPPKGGDEEDDDTDDPNPSFTVDKKLVNLPEKGYFTLGETAKFEITVVNDGNLTLSPVTVTEELKGTNIAAGEGYTVDGDNAVIATLKPGETVVIRASYTITEDDLGKELVNSVTAKGNGPKDPEDEHDEEDVPTDDATRVYGRKTWDDQDNRFSTRPETITLRLFADGAAYKTAEIGAEQGWAYTFDKLPVHNAKGETVVYTVTEDEVPGYAMTAVETEHGMDFTNTLRQYTLHIDYTYIRHKGGMEHQAFPPVDMVLYYGEKYSVKSPKLWGYLPNIPVVEGTITQDTVVHVKYKSLDYTLTIDYVYEDGTTAAPTYTEVMKIYDNYGVASPKIPGYVPTWEFVAGKMYAHDVSYRIVYKAIKPLGVGDVTLNLGDCFE